MLIVDYIPLHPCTDPLVWKRVEPVTEIDVDSNEEGRIVSNQSSLYVVDGSKEIYMWLLRVDVGKKLIIDWLLDGIDEYPIKLQV